MGKYCFFLVNKVLCTYCIVQVHNCKKNWFNGLSKLYFLVCEVLPDSNRVLPKGFTIAVADR